MLLLALFYSDFIRGMLNDVAEVMEVKLPGGIPFGFRK